MKKLMVLGGNVIQAYAISIAKELGYYVISTDLHPDNPGHKISDEYCEIDILDKKAVLEVAKARQIDGIIPYCSDVLAPVAAYVAEKMRLPGNRYHSISLLQNKGMFRQFMQENGIPHPVFRVCDSMEQALSFFKKYGNSILKPVDSSGGRGVYVINSEQDIQSHWVQSLEQSSCGQLIIERYIDRIGCQFDADFFVQNGKIKFWGVTSQLRLEPNLKINGLCIPPYSESNEMHKNALAYTQKIIDGLSIKQGPFNIEYITNGSDVFILDIGPRNGGICLPNLLDIAYGSRYTEWTIKSAVGDVVQIGPSGYEPKPSLLYLASSDKEGLLKNVEINEELADNLEYSISLVNIGEPVHRFSLISDAVAIYIFVFDSVEEMSRSIPKMKELVRVIVE